MSRGFFSVLLCGLLSAPSLSAAPDPMSAGSLRSVEISVQRGDVYVTLAKTQHVRMDGREADARRVGPNLRVTRAQGDLRMTVPPNVSLKIRAPNGSVHVRGSVKNLDVETAGGAQSLKLGLHANAVVRAVSGLGDIEVTLGPAIRARIDAKSTGGEITSLKSDPKSLSVLTLRSKQGDIVVRYSTELRASQHRR